MGITYYFLSISVLAALFQKNRVVLYACLIITSIAALIENVMGASGALSLILLTLLVFSYFNYKSANTSIRILLFALISILIAAIVEHDISGFYNEQAISNVTLSNARRPLSMYLNFDKVMAGLIVFVFSPLMLTEKPVGKQSIKQTFIIGIACVTILMAPAIISGYVNVDLKMPHIFAIWVLNNFLFVCFSEEVIYRGFMQNAISKVLPAKLWSVSIVLASIVFGLAHYKSGVIFIGLATLSGLFYGYTYYKTRRVLCAMLVHFALNFTHFMAFTYPS